MAVILVEGFEHGEEVATGYSTAGQRVKLWDTYNATATAIASKETGILPGSWSGCALRISDNDAAGAVNLVLTSINGLTRVVGSFRFRFVTSLPATDLEMFMVGANLGFAGKLVFQNSDSKIYAGFQFSGEPVAVSAALSADTWYQVDFDWDATGNPNTLKAKIGAVEATSSMAQVADTNINIRIGATTAGNTGTWIIDDLVLTDNGADYPLGPMKVYGLAPSSNGTHNTSTSFTQVGGTGGNWWTSIDSWGSGGGLEDQTEYIQQGVNGATSYIEIGFESLPSLGSDTVLGAGIAFMIWASTTGANGAICWVADSNGGTVLNTVFTGDCSDTAPRYQRWRSITAPGGGWSESAANTLHYRCGGATAIPGNPRFGATILQVAVQAGAVAAPGRAMRRRRNELGTFDYDAYSIGGWAG